MLAERYGKCWERVANFPALFKLASTVLKVSGCEILPRIQNSKMNLGLKSAKASENFPLMMKIRHILLMRTVGLSKW